MSQHGEGGVVKLAGMSTCDTLTVQLGFIIGYIVWILPTRCRTKRSITVI